jgi:hypothetical protein
VTTIIDEGGQTRARPPGPERCLCVVWHRPTPTEPHRHHVLPLAKPWNGPDATSNLVWLCPTSHSNCHELLRAYLTHHGRPPAEVVKPFGRYVRKLAARAWAQHTANGGMAMGDEG